MKSPSKKSVSSFTAFSEEIPVPVKTEEREVSEHFASDLHDDNSVMLAEIYGDEFQKVWKRTHKKWWL
jgi:hypothetical protein